VIDGAKGVETQTRKLMTVCRMRKTPVIVFINKMDREGQDPFDLLDEIENELQIHVRPLSWPINQGVKFKGVYNIYENNLNLYQPDKQKVTEKVQVDIHSSELDDNVGSDDAERLRADLELIDGVYPEFDVNTYLAGEVAPVFFGSALNNFGVQELLDCFVRIAPQPRPTQAEERQVVPEEPKFTGFIFKITANIDPNHRSCIAFCKVCSGKFVRNAPYLHVRQGKTVRFSSPTQFMAQKKSTIDEAYPGDIVGLPDNGIFKIGDTLTEGENLHFKGLPSFSPEMFKYIENADPMRSKQLAKGIDQLMDEGVAQLFVNQFNGRKIIGTVGQLQFEVIQYRLENEYNAKCRWEPISLYKACWIDSDDEAELENFKKRKYQYMAKDKDGRDVFLADSGYVLQMAQSDFKNIRFHFTSEF
jgi:peptide chain release factor 3